MGKFGDMGILTGIFFLGLAQAANAAGVSVGTPANNAVVTSPFNLQAQSTSCDAQPVATMAYSIGNGANAPAVNGTSLNAQVSVPLGTQVIHVKSWGNKGAGCDSDISVSVVASGVTVLSPANLAIVTSPFTLQGESAVCNGQPVSTMAYSVGTGPISTPVNGNNLNQQVSLPGGNQIVHVKSWGNKGAGCVSDLNLTVVSNGVTVTTPANNTTLTSPFTLQAESATCAGQPVSTMAYSIGNGANSPAVNGTSLNAQVTASSGSNQVLHVKSWGNQGAGCDADITFSIKSAATPTPTPKPVVTPTPTPVPSKGGFDGSSNIPSPPSNATNFAKIQQLNGWKGLSGAASQCPNGVPSATCNPVTANFSATVEHPGDPLALAGSDGISGLFEVYQSPADSMVVWGHSIGTDTAVRNFIWDFYVYVPTTNYGNSEFDLYYSYNNGQRFMMGSQCDRWNNTWDTWNEETQHWIQNAAIKCSAVLTAGKWHRVTWYNSVNTTNNTYTYHTLRIDGVDYVLNQTQPTAYSGWPEGLIGVQIQLDLNGSGNGVSETIENMHVYAW